MLAAAQTQARELGLSVDARVGGDSNVFRTENDPVRNRDETADGYFEISPEVSVREQGDALNYDFRYRPTYEAFFETSGVDGFDHRAIGDVTWRVTPVDTVGVTSGYLNSRRLRFDAETSSGSSDLEVSDRERIRKSEAGAFYQRFLNPVTSVQVSFNFEDYDFAENTNFDNRSYSGQVLGQYQVNQQLRVGTSVGARRRESRPVSDSDNLTIRLSRIASTTSLVDAAFSVTYDFSPTLSSSIQVGPSFINTQQQPDSFQQTRILDLNPDPPPLLIERALVPFTNKNDITVFVSGSTEKRWKNTDAEIAYMRSEAPGGGNGASSISDQVTLRVSHRFGRATTLRVEGAWNQRKQIVSLAGQNDLETTRYQAVSTLTHKLSRQWTLIGQYSYRTQDQDGGARVFVPGAGFQGTDNSFDVHTGFISLRYTFDPLIF